MTYNTDDNAPCDECGITSKEADKRRVGADYTRAGITKFETSFRLGYDGSVLCAKCYKEKSLEKLFTLMDKRERGECSMKKKKKITTKTTNRYKGADYRLAKTPREYQRSDNIVYKDTISKEDLDIRKQYEAKEIK